MTLCLGLAVDVMLHPGPAQHAETAVSSHYSCLCPFGCGLCLHLPETLRLLSACNELLLSLDGFPGTERQKNVSGQERGLKRGKRELSQRSHEQTRGRIP